MNLTSSNSNSKKNRSGTGTRTPHGAWNGSGRVPAQKSLPVHDSDLQYSSTYGNTFGGSGIVTLVSIACTLEYEILQPDE
jgi:hypothetical protein